MPKGKISVTSGGPGRSLDARSGPSFPAFATRDGAETRASAFKGEREDQDATRQGCISTDTMQG